MKPYGRNQNIKGRSWKKDYHIKDAKNWWEDYDTIESRTYMKQKIKKQLEKELDEFLKEYDV